MFLNCHESQSSSIPPWSPHFSKFCGLFASVICNICFTYCWADVTSIVLLFWFPGEHMWFFLNNLSLLLSIKFQEEKKANVSFALRVNTSVILIMGDRAPSYSWHQSPPGPQHPRHQGGYDRHSVSVYDQLDPSYHGSQVPHYGVGHGRTSSRPPSYAPSIHSIGPGHGLGHQVRIYFNPYCLQVP